MLLSELVQLDEANVYNVNRPLTIHPGTKDEITFGALDEYIRNKMKAAGQIMFGEFDVTKATEKRLINLCVNQGDVHPVEPEKMDNPPDWVRNSPDLSFISTMIHFKASGTDIDGFAEKDMVNRLVIRMKAFHAALLQHPLTPSSKTIKIFRVSISQCNSIPELERLFQHVEATDERDGVANEFIELATTDTVGHPAMRTDGMTVIMHTRGYSWEEITSNAALHRAGTRLNNCLKGYHIEAHLRNKSQVVYVLRDTASKALRVSVRADDYEGGMMHEARITNNQDLTSEFAQPLVDLMKHLNIVEADPEVEQMLDRHVPDWMDQLKEEH